MKRYWIALAAAALGIVPAGFAQDQAQERTDTANRISTDSSFATKTAEGGMAEVQLGNLAKDHAFSPDVKASASEWSTTTPRPTRS